MLKEKEGDLNGKPSASPLPPPKGGVSAHPPTPSPARQTGTVLSSGQASLAAAAAKPGTLARPSVATAKGLRQRVAGRRGLLGGGGGWQDLRKNLAEQSGGSWLGGQGRAVGEMKKVGYSAV